MGLFGGGSKIVEEVVVKGDSTSAQKAAKDTGASLTGAFVKGQLAVQAFNKVLSVATDQLKAGVKDAAEYQRTTISLNTALEATGQAGGNAAKALEAEAAALQDITGTSDEVIRKMQAQAISFGINARETRKLIKASFGLANAMDRDVKTVFDGLIKSTSGLTDRTLALIPEVRELTKEELKSGEAIDIAAEKFGRFASLAREGIIGSVIDLKNAWADLREQIILAADGSALQSFMDRMAGGIKNMALALRSDQSLTQLLAMPRGERMALLRTLSTTEQRGAQFQREFGGEGGFDFGAKDGKSPTREKFLLSVGGGKKGGGKAKPSVDFGEMGDPGSFGMGELHGGALANLELMQSLDQTIRVTREEQWGLHYETMQAQRERDAENFASIEEQKFDTAEFYQERTFAVATSLVNRTTDEALGALERWASGAEVRAAEAAVGTLKGVGRELIGKGISDSLQATAMLIKSRGADPAGWALLKTGGAEIGAGTTLFGGALLLGGGSGKGGGGGGGEGASAGGGAGASSFAGGSRGRDTDSERGGRVGPENITIVFNGPTTGAEVGVAINNALGEARGKGLI